MSEKEPQADQHWAELQKASRRKALSAFTNGDVPDPHGDHVGMRLMDYFAAHALTALIDRDSTLASNEPDKYGEKVGQPFFYGDPGAYTEVAKEAYCLAWGMMNARERWELNS